ncbi:LysR family transcriptional regulator [Burkholderia sp. L27(2015)]|uniref:LysR family transcriptional regulator n=1 Tax=Burkholderia sp. L27(2015) TaxID=1641858 RepID=UPI00131BF3E0|nr:LysR family transcriptional regulator [Burkholderia sp. L27(2015)]
MNLSLKQLKVFLGVANASSFTKTAQSMHLSQAALSAIIRELETQLQCRLLDRTTRTVSLTEAGRMFYPTAVKIVETLEKSALELNEFGRQEQSSLLVGCTPIIAASLMPAVLSRFVALHPAAEAVIVDTTPAELQRMVEDGDLDAAFGAFFSSLSGIDRHPICPTQLMAVSSLQETALGPASRRTPLNWRALEGLPLICLAKDNPLQRLIEATLSKEDVTSGKRMIVGHLQTAIAMAQAGLGVAVIPSFCEHACRHYRVRLDALRPEVELSFYRITRAGRGELALLDQFTEIFAQAARQMDGGLRAD